MEKALKKETKCVKNNKKWTRQEIELIYNYLEQADTIEVPTAQMFYKKLISATGINASWDLVKWKVRYLETTYKKATDWRNSTGAGLLENIAEMGSVDTKVLEICPHYHSLSKIFGEKRKTEILFEVIDTGETYQMDDSFNTNICDETAGGISEDPLSFCEVLKAVS